MAELKPFAALRFTGAAGDIAALTCPPYDIISPEERAAYLDTNPHNIIRLELPQGENICKADDPYTTAGELLQNWLEKGLLACDGHPAFYVYEEEFTALGRRRRVKGFVCRVRLEEWDKGVVLPHEETLSKAKEDRFRLMRATGCNFSSIYSLYMDREQAVVPLIDRCSAGEPALAFTGPDGVVHRVWEITDPAIQEEISRSFGEKPLYIADGHHRYETALRYRDCLREQGVIRDDSHPANFVMMTLVNMEHPGLVVFPTHRIVRELPQFDPAALLQGCATWFTAKPVASLEALQQSLEQAANRGEKAVGFCAPGLFTLLTLRPEQTKAMAEALPGASDAYRNLDVNILHSLILERLLQIDKENMANQKNLTYTRDAAEAVGAVERGDANCAFLINPTRVEEIAAVAEAGEKMPQKSTYFYPKLITGHIMNRLL